MTLIYPAMPEQTALARSRPLPNFDACGADPRAWTCQAVEDFRRGRRITPPRVVVDVITTISTSTGHASRRTTAISSRDRPLEELALEPIV